MNKIRGYIAEHKRLGYVMVGLVYLLITFYYMTPQFLHCNTTVYGFGDNTSGQIWRHQVSPQSPLWGYENETNYPTGENLYNPTNYSGSLQYTYSWVLAKIAGPICGYNIMNIVGFVASALVMYGFVYSFTRRKWIAILAGYAVAFSPYFQVKSGGHPSYGYQALLIGAIWVFYNLLKKRRKRDAVLLGILMGIYGYWDPYFVLLGGATLFPLFLVWLILNFRKLLPRAREADRKTPVQQLKLLVLSLGTAAIIFSPLAAIKLKDSQQINSYVSSSRGNVLYETRACSILPYEYAVPFVLNPIFNHLVGKEYYQRAANALMLNFKCGIGEDSISISLMVITFVGLGSIVFIWERINRRKIGLSSLIEGDYRLLIWGAVAGVIFAAALALPPVRFHGVPSPSYGLIKLTDTWRTIARLYVVVNIYSIILFAVVLTYFANHFKKNRRLLKYALVLISLIMFIEYQAFAPFKGDTLSDFNYKKDAPAAYEWLKDQQDIKTIAEYPMERIGGESEAEVYYQTMQSIHHKKLLNSALPDSPQDLIRDSLRDISDPQTVPVLHALGIDAVVIHGVPIQEINPIPQLTVERSDPEAPRNLLGLTPTVTYDNIIIAKIDSGPATAPLLELSQGFPRNTDIIHSAADWEYEAIQNSLITIGNASKTGVSDTNKSSPETLACFDIKMAGAKDTDQVVFDVDGKNSEPLNLTDSYQRVRLAVRHSIELHDSYGHNMRIQNLGCSSSETIQTGAN